VSFLEAMSPKAKYLAARVKFLTEHNPNLKIILASESNGTVLCDKVLSLLKNNPRVYTIQTGPPFWHHSPTDSRALRIRDNGVAPDSFSNGDLWTIIKTNFRVWLGIAKPEEYVGHVLLHIRRPRS